MRVASCKLSGAVRCFFRSVRSIAGRRQPPPMGSSSSRALQQACRHLQVVSQSADTRSLAPFEERGGYLRRQYISPLLESNFLSIMAGAPHSPPLPLTRRTSSSTPASQRAASRRSISSFRGLSRIDLETFSFSCKIIRIFFLGGGGREWQTVLIAHFCRKGPFP